MLSIFSYVFSEEMSFNLLPILKLGYLLFCCLVMHFLYIGDARPLSDDLEILSPFSEIFTFLIVSFESTKVLNFDKSSLSLILFDCLMHLVSFLGNHCLI